ncbi:MAG: sucrase ferredoxin [Acidimicrobiales bacterium]
MDLSLLPAVDEIIGCADHARGLAVDPGGSAITADVLIGVEVPLPWPKPVFDHPLLHGLDRAAAEASVAARVLAAVPLDPAASDAAVVAYRRRGASMVHSEVRVDPADIAAAVQALLDDPTGTADSGPADRSRPELWVCTQGSHDSCCGRDGTRLAIDVAAAGTDVVVRRVSHTGGHRFAPTALTLPDGRMWGYIDPTLVDQVVHRSGSAAELAERCRGWTGASTGFAQVAERAVFADAGWSLDEASREITVLDSARDASPGTATVQVRATWPDGAIAIYEVGVATVREVPTIACREPGGLPAKPGREYGVTSLRRID